MDADRLGKYEIRSTLGRGAMGTVYLGWDPMIDRKVAIKTVRLPDASDIDAQEELARFKREAQAAGRLTHPNIVGVFDYGETDEVAYIVMEFVDGHTLKSLLDKGERLALAAVGRVMADLLAGLRYSHERGVIHRDIKPANIMITGGDGHGSGQAKIADFGIARIESSNMTQAGTIMGTPAYMSPEQFMGQTVDARTDIYSSGVMLFQLLTGDRPFEGSMATIMHKALNTVPPKPSELSVTAPVSLDSVVARAMARRPEDRFPTAEAFAEAMVAAIANPNAGRVDSVLGPDLDDDFGSGDATVIATAQKKPGPKAAAPAKRAQTPPPAKTAAKPEKQGSKLPAIAGAAVVVLALASGGAWYVLSGPTPAPTPTPTPTPTPVVQAPVVQTPGEQTPGEQTRVATADPPQPPQPVVPTQVPPPPEPPTQLVQAPTQVPAQPPPRVPAIVPDPPPTQPVQNPPVTQVIPPTPARPPQQLPPVVNAYVPPPQVVPPTQPVPTQPIEPARPPQLTPQVTPQVTAIVPPVAPPVVVPVLPPTPPIAVVTPPQPPPVLPPVQQPQQVAVVALTPEALRRAVSNAVASADCAVIAGDVARTSGTVQLRGLIAAGPPEQELHRALQDAAPTAAVDWNLSVLEGPYCGVLNAMRPYARPFGVSSGGMQVTTKDERTTLVADDRVVLRAALPDYPSYLQVDYFANDGSVAHLRKSASGGTAYPANLVQQVDGGEVDQPFGTDLVVTIASSTPLFGKDQPLSDRADAYLRELRTALDNVSARRGRLAAGLLMIRTLPKR